MTLTRITIHLYLSTFYSQDEDKQVVSIAKRYLAKTVSPRLKKPLKMIINSPRPAELVRRVYMEQFRSERRNKTSNKMLHRGARV